MYKLIMGWDIKKSARKWGRKAKAAVKIGAKVALTMAKVVYNPENDKLFSTDHVLEDMHNVVFEGTPLEILSEEDKNIRKLEKEKEFLEDQVADYEARQVEDLNKRADITKDKEEKQRQREASSKYESDFDEGMTEQEKSDVSQAERERDYAGRRKRVVEGNLTNRRSTILTSPLGEIAEPEAYKKRRKTILGG